MNNRWLHFGTGPNGRMPVFCFPFAGGGAYFYRPWVRSAPSSIAIVPVQPPGRDERMMERPFERMRDIVGAAADQIVPLLRGPYALFGHSMGGMMAYELAQEIRRRNAPSPRHLFVSGAPAPHRAAEIPAIYDLPDDELIAEIQRRYLGLPKEVLESAELLNLLLPRFRADLAVTGTYAYQPAPPLNCPITAFGGETDETVTPDMVEAWREHTVATFRFEIFAGGHFFVSDSSDRILAALGEAAA